MKARIHENFSIQWWDDSPFVYLNDHANRAICWYDGSKDGGFGGMLIAEADVKEGTLPRKVLNTFKMFCLRNKLTLGR